MNREEILKCAKICVCGDREQDYGSPENNFELKGIHDLPEDADRHLHLQGMRT